MTRQLQWIFGRMDPKHAFDIQSKMVKSGQMRTVDNVSQGYAPTQEGSGVLYSWKNTPLAYVNIPTLNRMVFSKALWEGLRNNDHLKYMLEGRSHWMGDCHKDKDEITFSEIAGRVNDFWIEGDMVMGDIDLMDTTNGLIIYNCAKTGRVANSSRGFGALHDRSDGLKEVVPDEYMHVSWDFVTFPAVNKCIMTMADDITSTAEVDNLSEYLKSLIAEAYDRNPKDASLQKLASSAGVLKPKKHYSISKHDRDTLNILNGLRKSYKLLHSKSNSRIIKSMAGGTRSQVVEEFHKDLVKRYPDFLWQLKEAKLQQDGSYRIVFLSRHKFEFNFKDMIYFVEP